MRQAIYDRAFHFRFFGYVKDLTKTKVLNLKSKDKRIVKAG